MRHIRRSPDDACRSAMQRWRASHWAECELMLDLETAARALGAGRRGPNASFAGVTTDSRRFARGDLFVALKGEHFDGHAFVDQALWSGAAAAMVAEVEHIAPRRAATSWCETRGCSGQAGGILAQPLRAAGGRGYRQQRQDHGQGDARGDAYAQRRRQGGACHQRQSEQRHRRAAHAAAPARASIATR